MPLPELLARRLRRSGCTKGNHNRRRVHDWGGVLFATTAARPGLSPQARADRVRDGKPLRRACRSQAATQASVFHVPAASDGVRRRGLGTADYAASSFLSLLFTRSACQIRGGFAPRITRRTSRFASAPRLGPLLVVRGSGVGLARGEDSSDVVAGGGLSVLRAKPSTGAGAGGFRCTGWRPVFARRFLNPRFTRAILVGDGTTPPATHGRSCPPSRNDVAAPA